MNETWLWSLPLVLLANCSTGSKTACRFDIDCPGSQVCDTGQCLDSHCVGGCAAGQYCGGSGCTVCNDDWHCGSQCLNCLGAETNKVCVLGACGCKIDADCRLGDTCVVSQCGNAQRCGNSMVDPGETCGEPGLPACPADCNDGNPCTSDRMIGSAQNCNAACSHSSISLCQGGDGCCPAGCNSGNDTDCSAFCGNGVPDQGETCGEPGLPSCPIDCDDGNPCTSDWMTGSALNCNVVCTFYPITECTNGDQCCPSGCSSVTDSDCVCVPDCEGKVCGSDGCDGPCPNLCQENQICADDQCVCPNASCSNSCCAPAQICLNGACEAAVSFETTFRACWAHMDTANTYDYAPTAFDDGAKWNIWTCTGDPNHVEGDHIYYTGINSQGYDPAPIPVISPANNDVNYDGVHACAPTVIKHYIPQVDLCGGQEAYRMYYECASRIYPNPPGSDLSNAFPGPARICHALSCDGISWRKWHKNDAQGGSWVYDVNANPSPVIDSPEVNSNCNYSFDGSRHYADDNTACLGVGNYGVGHPSAVLMPDGYIWLWYYDSKGDWNRRATYLAKGWDGFHWESFEATNVVNPIEVKYFDIPVGGHLGVFIGTIGINASNYYLYSYDGLHWEWPDFANNPTGNYDHLKIGVAIDGQCTDTNGVNLGVHCAAPAQPAIIGDPHGLVHSFDQRYLLSGEGFLGVSDGCSGNGCACYNPAEDANRGATWGIYLIQGDFRIGAK